MKVQLIFEVEIDDMFYPDDDKECRDWFISLLKGKNWDIINGEIGDSISEDIELKTFKIL